MLPNQVQSVAHFLEFAKAIPTYEIHFQILLSESPRGLWQAAPRFLPAQPLCCSTQLEEQNPFQNQGVIDRRQRFGEGTWATQ